MICCCCNPNNPQCPGATTLPRSLAILDDTLIIDPPEALEPCPVNLLIRLTNDLEIQILTGQDSANWLSASIHCRDLFSASCRRIWSFRQMTIVWMESAPNNAGTLDTEDECKITGNFQQSIKGLWSYRWICPYLIVPAARRSSAIRVMESAAIRARTSLSASAGDRFSMALGRTKSIWQYLQSVSKLTTPKPYWRPYW